MTSAYTCSIPRGYQLDILTFFHYALDISKENWTHLITSMGPKNFTNLSLQHVSPTQLLKSQTIV